MGISKRGKAIVIVGPTASGKTGLSLKLAKEFGGEIISADSRQVYQGLDIGSGKVSQKEQQLIPHYLLDVASPNEQFTVTDFKRLAKNVITNIRAKNKLPIIVGGTAFYVYALIDNIVLPEVPPNPQLRQALSRKTPAELFTQLVKLDPERSKSIDPYNKVRLIRALEIVQATGKPVPHAQNQLYQPQPRVLFLGIKKTQPELYRLIDKRLTERLGMGMVKEVKELHQSGATWEWLESLGLEYRFIARYLQGKLTYDQMVTQLQQAIHHFAKRQMTWFKADPRIHWVKDYPEAEALIQNFLR